MGAPVSWSEGVLLLPLALSLLGDLTEGHWEVARTPWCDLRSKTSYSASAWPLFALAHPPTVSSHLSSPFTSAPAPLSITLFIPLAPAPEEERAGPPPQEGRWGRAAPAGREGKRREGRKWPTEEGGIRWEGAALFELLSFSALQSQAQGHGRTKVLLPSPRTHAGTACLSLEGTQVFWGACLREVGRVQCVLQTVSTCFINVSVSFCFFSVQQSQLLFCLFMPQVRERILNIFLRTFSV